MRLDNSGGGADQGANQGTDREWGSVGGQHAPYGFRDAYEFIGSHSPLTMSGTAGARALGGARVLGGAIASEQRHKHHSIKRLPHLLKRSWKLFS